MRTDSCRSRMEKSKVWEFTRLQHTTSSRQLSWFHLRTKAISLTPMSLLVAVIKRNMRLKTIDSLTPLRHSIEPEVVRSLFLVNRPSYCPYTSVSSNIRHTGTINIGHTQADIMISPNPFSGGQSCSRGPPGWSMLSIAPWHQSIQPVSHSDVFP